MLYTYLAKVEKVIDGDTVVLSIDLGFNLELKNQIFRLCRINAYELKGKDEQLGNLAKKFVESSLEVGKYYQIRTVKDKKDKYGRYLVEIYLPDGKNLNDLLVENKLAVYVL